MAENVKRTEYLLKPSESDAKRQLPLPTLISQIIDIATDHANELGFGFLDLSPKGIGWVLSRVALEMKRWPETGERYTLATWIDNWNAHYSERCFSVTDAKGEAIGYARTVWMIIDLKSHASVGTAGMPLDPSLLPGLPCPIERSSRHRPFEAEKTTEYTFKFCDLDFYRHVNTIRYLQLLLNNFTLEELDSHDITRMETAFQHEAKYGQTALISSIDEPAEEDGLKRTFSLTIEGRPILSASFTLNKR